MFKEQEIIKNISALKSYSDFKTNYGFDSDDYVQETIINALQGNYKEDWSMQKWLRKILLNLVIDQDRKKKIDINNNIEINDRLKIKEKQNLKINVKKIKQIIRTYQYQGRDTIILRFIFGLKYREISKFLDTPSWA